MAYQPKDIDETEKELKNQIEEQAQSSTKNKKIPSKVLLASTIVSLILIFFISSWFIYDRFLQHSETLQETNYYVAIPEIVVNLRSVNPKGNILRATFSLQICNKEEEPKIKEFMPIILDQLLSYLRDQSINDLEGPGLARMREAILLRINNIIRPIKIHRVVLKDFIIQ